MNELPPEHQMDLPQKAEIKKRNVYFCRDLNCRCVPLIECLPSLDQVSIHCLRCKRMETLPIRDFLLSCYNEKIPEPNCIHFRESINEKHPIVGFCSECDRWLCEICFEQHKLWYKDTHGISFNGIKSTCICEDQCIDPTKAFYYCLECRKYLCDDCLNEEGSIHQKHIKDVIDLRRFCYEEDFPPLLDKLNDLNYYVNKEVLDSLDVFNRPYFDVVGTISPDEVLQMKYLAEFFDILYSTYQAVKQTNNFEAIFNLFIMNEDALSKAENYIQKMELIKNEAEEKQKAEAESIQNNQVDLPNNILYSSIKDENEPSIIKYRNGNKYIGFIRNRKKEGFGIYIFNNGDRYIGEWKNGKKEGNGKYIFYPNNNRYEGEYKNNLRNGFGTYYYSENEYYQGEWKDGLREGYGINVKDGQITFEGQYFRGFCNGIGRHNYSYLETYEGEFLNGHYEGVGSKTYLNGDTYFGEFKKSMPDGFGIYRASNKDVYIGYFLKGVRWNFGVAKFVNGDSYSGLWSNDFPNGIGKYTFGKDNSYCIGEFKDGKSQGFGEFFRPANEKGGEIRFIGEFNNDYFEGIGYSFSTEGSYENYFEGEWKKGKRNGIGIQIKSNEEGNIYGEFKDDAVINSTSEI
ncbi:MAG: hypothetical protein MJ252_05230 [archaeon]|nr:hypothetical protein [archaeon]